MNLLKQFCIIFAICMVCEGISGLLPVSFPASVLALVMVLIFLMVKFLKATQIESASQLLLAHLPLWFIPPSVSIYSYWDVVASSIVPFLLVCFLTLAITYGVTAWSVSLCIKLMNRGAKK